MTDTRHNFGIATTFRLFTQAMVLAFGLTLGVVGQISTTEAANSSCQITAIDAKTGLVTARETATGHTFQFKIDDARLLTSLRPGQAVQADFQVQLVSIPGVASRYKIVSVTTQGQQLPQEPRRGLSQGSPTQSSPGGTKSDTSGVPTERRAQTPAVAGRGKDSPEGSLVRVTWFELHGGRF